MKSAGGLFLSLACLVLTFGQAIGAELSLTLDKQRYAPGEEIVITTSCPVPAAALGSGFSRRVRPPKAT